jgi:hypothetical protein
MKFLPIAASLTVIALTSAVQAAPAIPSNTVSCSDFKRNADGSWSVVKQTSFAIAGRQAKLDAGSHITGDSYFYNNNRLIDTLNAKCAK